MAIPAEVIENRYEATYIAHLVGIRGEPMTVKIKAKRIVKTSEDTTFYDYYGRVSGCFRNDILLGYVAIER